MQQLAKCSLFKPKQFGETINITGSILTKLDGTAKGNFLTRHELNILKEFIYLGEQ